MKRVRRVTDPVPPNLRRREEQLAALAQLQEQRIRAVEHTVAGLKRSLRDTQERLAGLRRIIAGIEQDAARKEDAA